MDETQDIWRREQVSLCLRYVDSKLQPAEIFFGFYHAKKTDAGSLLDILKSALEELHLPFCNLRGQGYDGAASMSGKESGLQTRVRQENPRALWVYCFGHNLNLVVQDFKEMVEQAQHQNKHELRPLCPTRWVMKLASVDIFLQHYPTVLEQLEITQNDRQLTSENRADARIYLRALEEFDTYFGMRVFQSQKHQKHISRSKHSRSLCN